MQLPQNPNNTDAIDNWRGKAEHKPREKKVTKGRCSRTPDMKREREKKRTSLVEARVHYSMRKVTTSNAL